MMKIRNSANQDWVVIETVVNIVLRFLSFSISKK